MNEFLKKLNDSLATGLPDDEVISHHYEILTGVDILKAQKENGGKDRELYENEILSYVSSGNTSAPAFKTSTEIFVEKITNARVDENYNLNKELIESNTAQIKLLNDEIEQLKQKIAKNLDLIEFLKFEMTRKK